MTDVVRLEDLDAISNEAAKRWAAIAQKAVAENGRFSIALSGGNTPRRLYQLMASNYNEQVPWAQTHVFWGDERRVAQTDSASDYRMARETLLDFVPIPPEQIHPMQGVGLASAAVRDYQTKLKRYFALSDADWPRFDLVLLGLGADGHTASIFPGTRAVSDLSNMVIVFEIPQLRAERITLTRPVFNNSKNILFMVSGADKAPALAATLEGPAAVSKYPAQSIQPTDGALTWLVDKAAAAELKSPA